MTTGQIVLLVLMIVEICVFWRWTQVAIKDVKRRRKFEDEAANLVASGWYCQPITVDGEDERHVYPAGEMHWPVKCHCGERRERYADGWIVVHHSRDGREAVDWAKNILDGK